MLGEEGGRIRTVPPQVAEGGAETCVFIHPCQLYWSVRAVRMFRAPGPCFQAIPRHPRGQFLLFFFFFFSCKDWVWMCYPDVWRCGRGSRAGRWTVDSPIAVLRSRTRLRRSICRERHVSAMF